MHAAYEMAQNNEVLDNVKLMKHFAEIFVDESEWIFSDVRKEYC